MKFIPKEFIEKKIKEGMSVEKAIFMVGFKTAIDCIEDIKEKGVPFQYGPITNELEITLSKIADSPDFMDS